MTSATEWRRLRGVLAALLVFLFAVSPALDVLICGDDTAVASEAHHAEGDEDEPCGDEDHSGGPCHHGHCHHAGAFTPSDAVSPGARVDAREQHDLNRGRVGALDMQFGLERPPRD